MDIWFWNTLVYTIWCFKMVWRVCYIFQISKMLTSVLNKESFCRWNGIKTFCLCCDYDVHIGSKKKCKSSQEITWEIYWRVGACFNKIIIILFVVMNSFRFGIGVCFIIWLFKSFFPSTASSVSLALPLALQSPSSLILTICAFCILSRIVCMFQYL